MLGIPILFEFISNIKEIQQSQGIFAEGGALHKALISKVLEALMEYENDAVQDIKNQKAADSISSI